MTRLIACIKLCLVTMVLLIFVASCSEQEALAKRDNTSTNADKSQIRQQPSVSVADNIDQSTSSGDIVAGRDYLVLADPIDTEVTSGIEVLEIFWFGCPHCYATQAYVEVWKKSKPVNAHLVRMPAPLRGLWTLHAQIFYTNQAMGLEEKLHMATFDAMHKEKLRLTSADDFARYYSKNYGIDSAEYIKTFNSFSVNLKLQTATNKVKQAQIRGVPVFIVAGKYLVNSTSAGSTPRIFLVINELIKIES